MYHRLTLFVLFLILSPASFAQVGTAFKYQGELTDSGVPANGSYDFVFSLFDAPTFGTEVTSDTLENISVMDGVFDATLDFGPLIFNGTQYWMELAVREGTSTGAHTTLSPRQEIEPVPYAMFATKASNVVNDKVKDGDFSQTNEVNIALDFNPSTSELSLVDNGGTLTADLGPLGDDADADPANELQDLASVLALGSDTGGFTVSDLSLDTCGLWTISTEPIGDFSLAIVDGRPHIAYYNFSSDDLVYIRANDEFGSDWGPPVPLDVDGDVGGQPSLKVVNGNPAIAYLDDSNGALKYRRATDAAGASWGLPPIILDSITDGFELHNSLAVINGNPAVSYYDATNGNLKYISSTDASGTTWGTPLPLDTTGDVGRYPSLTVVNGNPAIAYYDGTNGDLKYIRATDASGTAWAIPVAVDTDGRVGRYTSMTIVNGNPAISYFDSDNGDLKFVRATDASGATWATPITPDSLNLVGRETTLAVIDGHPAIAYLDVSNFDLKYVRATDADGTTWEAPVTLDTDGSVGYSSSLFEYHGKRAIAWLRQSNPYAMKFSGPYVLPLDANKNGRLDVPLSHVLFEGNDAEGLDISNLGNVGIGTAATSYALEVNGSAAKPGGGSWSNSSDARLKKNVKPLTGALEKLLDLRGVTFEFIDPEFKGHLEGQQIGLIAQEVAEVFPNWVSEDADGYLTVTVQDMAPLVAEALREQQITIENQATEIETLKTENQKIRDQNEHILMQINEITAQLGIDPSIP